MRVVPLGTGAGGVPRPGGAGTGLLFAADDPDDADGATTHLQVDMGNGVLGNLVRHLDYGDVDAVCLTHLHHDHTLDLMPFLLARTRFDVVPVHAPPGGSAFVEEFVTFFSDNPTLYLDQVQVTEYAPGEAFDVGPFAVHPVRVEHSVPAHALRITGPAEDGDGEAVVCYSADTRRCDALVEAALGADLFLCEATFLHVPETEKMRTHHLTGLEAGEVARDAGVGRLLLTHTVYHDPLEAFVAEAEQAFDGPVGAARENAVYGV